MATKFRSFPELASSSNAKRCASGGVSASGSMSRRMDFFEALLRVARNAANKVWLGGETAWIVQVLKCLSHSSSIIEAHCMYVRKAGRQNYESVSLTNHASAGLLL